MSDSLDPLLDDRDSELNECLLSEDCSLRSLEEDGVDMDKEDWGMVVNEGLMTRELRA